MRELAVANPRRGRRYVMELLRKERCSVGTRLMKRLWPQESLLAPQKRAKRRRIGTGENGIKRRRASMKNEVWGMDFVQDRTADGRPFRMLVVLDEYTRECLAIEVARNFRGEDIVAVLDELTAIRGAPAHLRADNGPEMISKAVRAWCAESGTGTLHIDPGSPWQNGIAESFNGRLRDELLSSEIFDTLAEARYLIDRWRLFYNHRRIQRALGKMTPAAFAAACEAAPPLRLASLACAAAPPHTQGATTMQQFSYEVDRWKPPRRLDRPPIRPGPSSSGFRMG
jgi:transposase InsO family protein